MKVSWEKDYDPKILLNDIISHLSMDGGICVQKIGVEISIDALYGRVSHPYNLDHDVLFSVFSNSVINSFKKDKLKPPHCLLAEFKRLCEKRLCIKTPYFLVTSINIKNIYDLKSRKINGCGVRFYKKIPKKYQSARAKLVASHPNLNLTDQENYLYVVVSVSSSDIKTAFKKAIGALDIIRSTLQIVYKNKINFLGNSKKEKYPSESVVCLGEFHTLHLKTGGKACSSIWYEESFKKKNAITLVDKAKVEKNLTYFLKKINKSNFEEHICEALKGYINALDIDNVEHRYMKLWAVIEQLIDSDNSRVIIKRVSFFYEDRSLTRHILESLRKARNITAHAGITPFNVEMKNYTICSYLDHLLKFFIDDPFKYNNLQKLLSFISLSTDESTIDEQIKHLETVKLFISKE